MLKSRSWKTKWKVTDKELENDQSLYEIATVVERNVSVAWEHGLKIDQVRRTGMARVRSKRDLLPAVLRLFVVKCSDTSAQNSAAFSRSWKGDGKWLIFENSFDRRAQNSLRNLIPQPGCLVRKMDYNKSFQHFCFEAAWWWLASKFSHACTLVWFESDLNILKF